MNKNFKCIIFDLDGTLIDSGPDLTCSLNHVLEKQGHTKINEDVLGGLVGGGAEMMIRKGYNYLNLKIEEDKIENYVNDFLAFYFNHCTVKTKLYNGVHHLLNILYQKNLKMCVCTNKKQHLTDKILKDFEIKKFFNYVLGSSEKLKMKPDIEMLNLCCKKLNVSAQECLMIGDSDNDIIPANKLGMKSIYVNYGYGVLKNDLNASFEASKVEDIKSYLDL